MSETATFMKAPAAILDFAFDWSAWLDTGETIASYTLDVPTGLTKGADSETGGVVKIWLSDGTDGTVYNVTCTITTSAGRTDQRSMRIQALNR